MSYWERVLEKLSIPGFLLLTAGIVLITQSAKLCQLLFQDRSEKWVAPIKLAGLLVTILGALILLDLIPGL